MTEIYQSGEVYRGVAAFWAIWQAFPSSTAYRLMGTLVNMPLVNAISRLFYKGFARIRPFLPQRHNCGSGTCNIGRKQ
jgi:predicted DCC family thiol-disulfide oxidoreductase YuxK